GDAGEVESRRGPPGAGRGRRGAARARRTGRRGRRRARRGLGPGADRGRRTSREPARGPPVGPLERQPAGAGRGLDRPT
ncbi:MAG: hypothetical protein AVDCRST_MAG79-3169, partial [uncultured Thermoleophilia bacterium]